MHKDLSGIETSGLPTYLSSYFDPIKVECTKNIYANSWAQDLTTFIMLATKIHTE